MLKSNTGTGQETITPRTAPHRTASIERAIDSAWSVRRFDRYAGSRIHKTEIKNLYTESQMLSDHHWLRLSHVALLPRQHRFGSATPS